MTGGSIGLHEHGSSLLDVAHDPRLRLDPLPGDLPQLA